MKVVVNKCYGGFGLSYEAVMLYASYSGFKLYAFVGGLGEFRRYAPKTESDTTRLVHYHRRDDPNLPDEGYFSERTIPRDNPNLVKVVEELGEKANGTSAKLRIMEIPDGTSYTIDEYDGLETIHEAHQSW